MIKLILLYFFGRMCEELIYRCDFIINLVIEIVLCDLMEFKLIIFYLFCVDD